jgi:hypothetical protein
MTMARFSLSTAPQFTPAANAVSAGSFRSFELALYTHYEVASALSLDGEA